MIKFLECFKEIDTKKLMFMIYPQNYRVCLKEAKMYHNIDDVLSYIEYTHRQETRIREFVIRVFNTDNKFNDMEFHDEDKHNDQEEICKRINQVLIRYSKDESAEKMYKNLLKIYSYDEYICRFAMNNKIIIFPNGMKFQNGDPTGSSIIFNLYSLIHRYDEYYNTGTIVKVLGNTRYYDYIICRGTNPIIDGTFKNNVNSYMRYYTIKIPKSHYIMTYCSNDVNPVYVWDDIEEINYNDLDADTSDIISYIDDKIPDIGEDITHGDDDINCIIENTALEINKIYMKDPILCPQISFNNNPFCICPPYEQFFREPQSKYYNMTSSWIFK